MKIANREDFRKSVEEQKNFGRLFPLSNGEHPNSPIQIIEGKEASTVKKYDSVQKRMYGLKYFYTVSHSRKARYDAIYAYLKQNPSCSFLTNCEYLPQELLIRPLVGRHPILQTSWVEGHPLHVYIQRKLEAKDIEGLQALANNFDKMAVELLNSPFAHGNIQHKHIIINDKEAPVLIDYERAYLPTMDLFGSNKKTLTAYQHPSQLQGGNPLGQNMDDFALLVISITLHALVKQPELWGKYNTEAGLLFQEEDHADLKQSTLFLELQAIPSLADRLKVLEESLARTEAHIPDLKYTLSNQKKKVVPRPSSHGNFILVEGGCFTMGSPAQNLEAEEREMPGHQVELSSFYISKYPVTFEEYDVYCTDQGLELKKDWNAGRGKRPVIFISWEEATAYTLWRSEKEGKKYRLPTEAEWEYAASGGLFSEGYVYAGANSLTNIAWFEGNSKNITQEVGQKQANELGLYDMSGNVWEWCSDWYAEYTSSSKTNPQGGIEGDKRVLRGGSCCDIASECRIKSRRRSLPNRGLRIYGFRLVLESSK